MKHLWISMLIWLSSTLATAGDVHVHTHWQVKESECTGRCAAYTSDDSSRANRRDKTLSLLYGFDGITAGWYLSPDTILEGTYQELDYMEAEDGTDNGPERFIYGLGVKRFHGNSFYTRWAIEHDHVNTGAYARDYVGTHAVSYAALGFGNQWQWDIFTLGVNWFQVGVPIYQQTRTTSSTEDRLRVGKMKEDEIRNRLEYKALNLQIGLSF